MKYLIFILTLLQAICNSYSQPKLEPQLNSCIVNIKGGTGKSIFYDVYYDEVIKKTFFKMDSIQNYKNITIKELREKCNSKFHFLNDTYFRDGDYEYGVFNRSIYYYKYSQDSILILETELHDSLIIKSRGDKGNREYFDKQTVYNAVFYTINVHDEIKNHSRFTGHSISDLELIGELTAISKGYPEYKAIADSVLVNVKLKE